jgi:hypothetical protein
MRAAPDLLMIIPETSRQLLGDDPYHRRRMNDAELMNDRNAD